MSRIAYVNGAYVPHSLACVHVEDRGYQFSDGVYEVWAVQKRQLLDTQGHLMRLQRSLRELDIPTPLSISALQLVLQEVIRRNRIRNGMVYLQITRGVAPRDHAWNRNLLSTLVMTARSIDPRKGNKLAKSGVKVITLPDLRWARRDIKSVSLLPNVLAKQKAREAGAYEAWLVDEQGQITEGTSSNAWIITDSGILVTRDLSERILAGITRAHVMQIASEYQLRMEERPFTDCEARQAKEAFMTAATNFVMPVISIDGHIIANGKPGPVAARLRKSYICS